MTCDLCETETEPGESICWDCVESISRNCCARCAIGDPEYGNLCADCRLEEAEGRDTLSAMKEASEALLNSGGSGAAWDAFNAALRAYYGD